LQYIVVPCLLTSIIYVRVLRTFNQLNKTMSDIYIAKIENMNFDGYCVLMYVLATTQNVA